jgi:hypothetical protein
MTRKDFELIATVLKSQEPIAGDLDTFDYWEQVCRALAANLRLSNPKFNTTKFLHACGVEG